MDGDADLASVAAAIGDPTRAHMLATLMDGRALPASELARHARVAPSTASSHLAKLIETGLVRVERHGRHRYHRLASPEVAEAIEALQALAPPQPVRSLRQSDQALAERAARSCYDHAAGVFGVALTDRFCELGALDRSSLGLRDASVFGDLGIDVTRLAAANRPLTRACLDWTERRHHLAGGLGAAVLDALLDRGWVERSRHGRALTVTPKGRDGLRDQLNLELGSPRVAA